MGIKRRMLILHLFVILLIFKEIFLYVSVLRNVDARGVPGIPWLINAQKLFEWANEVKIDPNNPEYSDLMEFIMVSYGKYQYCIFYFLSSTPLYFVVCCIFF